MRKIEELIDKQESGRDQAGKIIKSSHRGRTAARSAGGAFPPESGPRAGALRGARYVMENESVSRCRLLFQRSCRRALLLRAREFLHHIETGRDDVARGGGADHLSRPVEIEAVGIFRAGDPARRDQRRERNHVAVVVSDVILIAVFFGAPLIPFRLEEHSPLPAEAIELVQKKPAEIGLQRLVNVSNRHALLERLVAIHVGVDLWSGG